MCSDLRVLRAATSNCVLQVASLAFETNLRSIQQSAARNDNAHFCAAWPTHFLLCQAFGYIWMLVTRCDAAHHSENEFFARHQRREQVILHGLKFHRDGEICRFALEHSPLQFGLCRHHPSERYESVCLQCKACWCWHGFRAMACLAGQTMLCRMCNKFGDHARKEIERTDDSMIEHSKWRRI